MSLLLTVIVVALIFEYINGFHDTANSIATVVSTKVLTPRLAIMLAAVTNLVGALYGTAVAKTISSGLLDAKLIPAELATQALICALGGAIIWNLLTWWFGLPSSSSHALIGGLVGSGIAAASNNFAVVILSKPKAGMPWYKFDGLLYKVIIPMFLSPIMCFTSRFEVGHQSGSLVSSARHNWPVLLTWASATEATTRRRQWASSPSPSWARTRQGAS
jgi:PiT family inorganic phosphate transporter